MRIFSAVIGAVLLAACGTHDDKHSASYEMGRAAHEATRDAGKAAVVVGRKLDESARKAHEGWVDQSRKDRENDREKRERK